MIHLNAPRCVYILHNVSFRTVHLDILALEEVYTWVTVSSVNVTATLTLATLRLASARYEGLD